VREDERAQANINDRRTIEAGAAAVRRTAGQDQYAGYQHPEFAYAVALLLDDLALAVAELPRRVRSETVRVAEYLAARLE
jgi:hypothetical protein